MTVVAITDEQRTQFEALRDPSYENFALVSTAFDGEPTVVIAAVTMDGDESLLTPLYVQVTDAMFARLSSPDEGLSS